MPLLRTKLYAPQPRPDLVVRARLLDRLDDGLRRRHALTLVAAPAGFGKTSLLSSWCERLLNADERLLNAGERLLNAGERLLNAGERLLNAGGPLLNTDGHPPSSPRVAWLSLGPEDNAWVQFWTYVIAALQTALPDVAVEVAAWLHSPQPPAPGAVAVHLANALTAAIPPEGAAAPLILVLDDYHLIDAPEIHESLSFLLDHLPPAVQLVIASRTAPPLPVARLRARGQLTEVRAADLRFTPGEALAFLNETMRLGLDEAAVATLSERTEGWVAGLQLAALSLQARPDAAAFVRDFAGSHRYVIDYLAAEVLDRQPEDVQAVLLQTSVLQRMCGALVDTVTGRDDGQAMLERLEAAQLFVTPLDDARHWYRYHPLFAEFLQSRLRRRYPEQVGTLHRRAAAWYRDAGQVRDAVAHALAVEDVVLASDLVTGAVDLLLTEGDAGTLLGWLGALPDALLRGDPHLALVYGWVHIYTLQFDQMRRWLASARAALPGEDRASRDTAAARLWGAWYAAHSYLVRFTRGDFATSLAQSRRALALLAGTPGTRFWADLAWLNIGFAHMTGDQDLDRAIDAFHMVVDDPESAANPYGLFTALNFLGRAQASQGRLAQATAIYERALDEAARRGIPATWSMLTYTYYGLAMLAWYAYDPAATRHWAEAALAPLASNENYEVRLNALLLLARAARAQGDESATDAALAALDALARRFGMAQIAARVEGLHVDLAVQRDDGAWLRQWVAAQATDFLARPLEVADAAALTQGLARARALLALGRAGEALAVTEWLMPIVDDVWSITGMTIRMVRALALEAAGRAPAAMAVLADLLAATLPEGPVVLYVEGGAPMARLLARYRAGMGAAAPASEVAERATLDHVDRLLAVLSDALPDADFAPAVSGATVSPATPQGGAPAVTAWGAGCDLPEPLTEREREVLGYLGTELSAPEIAGVLYVAPSTVRSHIKALYGKLDVHNRGEAVARALELGLL
jgi:LuxR family maltose regulon positive regulatory protein